MYTNVLDHRRVLRIEDIATVRSEGKPSEEGLKLDAEATLEHILAFPPLVETISTQSASSFLVDHSVALLLSNLINLTVIRSEGSSVVIENTFTSIGDNSDIVDHLMHAHGCNVQKIHPENILAHC